MHQRRILIRRCRFPLLPFPRAIAKAHLYYMFTSTGVDLVNVPKAGNFKNRMKNHT